MMSLDEQKRKWAELDAFFKNNSNYYKQIDNDEITFFLYPCGTGGNFLANLFLDVSEIPVKVNNCYPGPPLDKINSLKLNFKDPDVYYILKYLDVSKIKDIKVADEKLKKSFSMLATDDIDLVTTHMLPVVAHFYYKNPEKIKTVYIERQELNSNVLATRNYFTHILCIIKNQLITWSPGDDIGLFDDPVFTSFDLVNVYPNKLITINYEKLFFNCNEDVICKLMDVFNSKKPLDYYKAEIRKYHEINVKLVTQFKNDITNMLLEKGYEFVEDAIEYDRTCGID